MRTTQFLLAACTLAAQVAVAHSKAISFTPLLRRHDNLHEQMKRASDYYAGDLERRSPQSSNGGLSLNSPDVEMNSTVETACMTAMSSMPNITNNAGWGICYNVLDWGQGMQMFQADLRIYQMTPPKGQFANVASSEITVMLNFPNITEFQRLVNTKRTLKRDESGLSPSEIQQFSLSGYFKDKLTFSKLNTTEMMSLVIPQVSIQATSTNQQPVLATIPVSDTAYFVAGVFKDMATPQLAAQAANPVMAAEAVTNSKGFVIPGRTLGIFPTGLIVTCAWTLMFFVVFGLGTFGRIRHRDVYRKRMAISPKGRK